MRKRASAAAAGVSYQVVIAYRRNRPGFSKRELAAELEAAEVIENALFNQAAGGNVTAIQVFLYNRLPKRWKDKRNGQTVVIPTKENATPTDDELFKGYAELARRFATDGESLNGKHEANGHGR